MTWALLAMVVAATVLSDLLQSYEMKRTGDELVTVSGIARIPVMIVRRRYLILSILCLAVSFFAFMALVQHTTLSFAVPASAASFVVETILASLRFTSRWGCEGPPERS